MATSLGIIDGDLVGAQLPTLPTLPGIPGIPGFPTYPTTVPLPNNPDGTVVAPPTVGTTSAPPVAPMPPPAPLAPPQPTFWDEYGGGIMGGFAIFGVLALASMAMKGRG